MAKNTDTTIHELTRAEIARQLAALTERRQEIVSKRGELYLRTAKGGPPSEANPDEKAARAYAKRWLNGAAPASLEPPSSDFSTLDRELAVEQRGIDIVVKILGDKDVAARAVEAVQWAEDHADEWRRLVHDIIVTAVRMEALKQATALMIGRCPDVTAINLPMAGMLESDRMLVAMPGFSGYLDVTPSDLIDAGLKAGVVTKSEIRKAQDL